ncbi:hypothetical protein NHX12_019195, partial [Muraenolepis orangiensis]
METLARDRPHDQPLLLPPPRWRGKLGSREKKVKLFHVTAATPAVVEGGRLSDDLVKQ